MIVLNIRTEWITNIFEQIRTHLPDGCTCILEDISLFGMRAGDKADGKDDKGDGKGEDKGDGKGDGKEGCSAIADIVRSC